MITVGTFVRIVLARKGMSLLDLANKMTELEELNGSSSKITNTHLSTDLNYNTLSVINARKIEIALNLEKFVLVRGINQNLSPRTLERLENVYSISQKEIETIEKETIE